MNTKDRLNSKRRLNANNRNDRPENNPKFYQDVIKNYKNSQGTIIEKTEKLLNTINRKNNNNEDDENFLDSDDNIYTSKSNSSSSYDSYTEESSFYESDSKSKITESANLSHNSKNQIEHINVKIKEEEIIEDKKNFKNDSSNKNKDIYSIKIESPKNKETEKNLNKEPKTFREWIEKNKSQKNYISEESDFDEIEESESSEDSQYSISKFSNMDKSRNIDKNSNFIKEKKIYLSDEKEEDNSDDKESIENNELVNGNGKINGANEYIKHNSLIGNNFEYNSENTNNKNIISEEKIENNFLFNTSNDKNTKNTDKNKLKDLSINPSNINEKENDCEKNIYDNKNRIISSIKPNRKKKNDYASFLFSNDKDLFYNDYLDVVNEEKSNKSDNNLIESDLNQDLSFKEKSKTNKNDSIVSNKSKKNSYKSFIEEDKKGKKKFKKSKRETKEEESFNESPIKQTNLLHRKKRKLKDSDSDFSENNIYSIEKTNFHSKITGKVYKNQNELIKGIFKKKDLIEPEKIEIENRVKTFGNGRYSLRNRIPKINQMFGERVDYQANENGLMEVKRLFRSNLIIDNTIKEAIVEKQKIKKKPRIKKKKEDLSDIEEDSSESENNISESILKDKRLNEFEEKFYKNKQK